jgi:hypothetical protein
MLGRGPELAESLEKNALMYDSPIPWLWLTAKSHPATELRIDRLEALNEQHLPDAWPGSRDSPQIRSPEFPTPAAA